MKICITGHRPNKLFGYDIHSEKYNALRHAIKLALWKLVKDLPADEKITVYSGMALGVDQIFVEEMAKARAYFCAQGRQFKIIAAVPCDNQDCKWTASSKKLYQQLLTGCDEVVNVSPNVPYSAALMQKRNEYMVNNSDIVIAVWNGTRGGTGNCVNYARGKNKRIVYVDPRDNSVHVPEATKEGEVA